MDKKPRSTDSANVRPARRDDVDAITELYGLYVAQGTMTFETIPPTAAEMAARLARVHEHGLPYVIAECDGRLAGFAYALPYRPRPAYRFTVESSVYVASFAPPGSGPADDEGGDIRGRGRRQAADDCGYRRFIKPGIAGLAPGAGF